MVIILSGKQQKFDCDVIVVGAGPAGSAAAFYLASAGYSTIILDKQKFPRDKVCGDFVSPIAQKELDTLEITHLPEFRRSNIISRASVYLDGNELISRSVPDVKSLPKYGRVVPRIILDKLLLDSACKKGADFLEGLKVVGLTAMEGGIMVKTEGPPGRKILKSRLLIGADGSNSIIAKHVRGHPPLSADRIIAIRGYFENVKGPQNQADLFFDKESFPGYCWLFPTGKTQANVGVGVIQDTIPPNYRLKELLNHLIKNNSALHDRLKGAKPVGQIRGWPLMTYNRNQSLIDNNIMLVGDAAGFVNPLNGEGIQYALLSGRWASEVAIPCLSANECSKEMLSTYSDRVDKELGYSMSIARLLVQLIRNRSFNPFWLRSMELIAAHSRVDPGYADIIGGILMGSLPQSEATSWEVVRGTLEQAMVSSALDLQDSTTVVKATVDGLQMGYKITHQMTHNPSAVFNWAINSTADAINLALLASSNRPDNAQK